MKKILHVTMSNAYGGAETVIFSIIENLKKNNEFYYMCPKGNIEEILKRKNINYKTIKIKELKKNIKSLDVDIIHAHDFKASILCSLYKGEKNIISHLHTDHDWLKKFSLKSLIYLIASIKFNKIIIVSKSMTNNTWFYKFIKKKVDILINPVDKSEIENLSRVEEINKNYDIAFLGRLSDYKDPLRFIDIVKLIKNEKADIKAIIIGDGELKHECIKKIEDNNLKKNIYMSGFLENPFPIIKKSKILVMPSKAEALGLSAMQSMVLGKPVVASNVGGLKDFINRFNGNLCVGNNEFKESILEILNNKKIYNNLSEGAKNTSDKLCNINDYMNKLNYIYNKEI
ncbi:glycosyltransferase [Clostridium sardiniense]|uniref:glycosyltransferase n=1 Tax=Clostridium sardiniense TaxID=29369 RepID=UPI003D343619